MSGAARRKPGPVLAGIKGQHHYQLLGVHRMTSEAELTAARRVLALEFHPDRHQDDPAATQLLGAVNAAFDVLADPGRRGRYLAELQSTMDPCTACAGVGFTRKQLGFSKVRLTGCQICAGSGFVSRAAAPPKKPRRRA